MPMTPFIGVRISWLMLARNSLLALLAAWASRHQLVGPLDGGLESDVGLLQFLQRPRRTASSTACRTARATALPNPSSLASSRSEWGVWRREPEPLVSPRREPWSR